jgi:hypothetical protein
MAVAAHNADRERQRLMVVARAREMEVCALVWAIFEDDMRKWWPSTSKVHS